MLTHTDVPKSKPLPQLKTRAATPPPSAAAAAARLALAERPTLLLGADGVNAPPLNASRTFAVAALAFLPPPALALDIVSEPSQATEGRETRRTRSQSTCMIDRCEAHEKMGNASFPMKVHELPERDFSSI